MNSLINNYKNMVESDTIYFSFGYKTKVSQEYNFLSNFYPSEFICNEIIYKTVEHYFQSEKYQDESKKQAVINAKTPGHAKSLGRKHKIDSSE